MAVLGNGKWEAVALHYIADPEKIGWRAYQRVYPKSSQHAAETAFSRLLKTAEFAARIAELAAAAAEGAVMSANEVLEELSKLGRANMRDFAHLGLSNDLIADVTALEPAQTAALQQLTVESYEEGRGEAKRTVKRVKFALHSKPNALDLLGKHHKLFVERVEHSFAGVAERLAAALLRADGRRQDGQIRAHEVRPHRHPPRKRDARKAARQGRRARAR